MAHNSVRDDQRHDERDDDDRQTASLAGLAISLALLVASLFLVYHLREKSHLEDCLLQGRDDCMVILPSDTR